MTFMFTLAGDGPLLTLNGGASDEDAARREAITFLADLLHDLAISDSSGSSLTVEARDSSGKLVCRAAATISATEA